VDERFLIIDTAHGQGHVALGLRSGLVETKCLEKFRHHARDLAPLVRELLYEMNWKPSDLAGVIVSRGPGSYTGLRVGLMSAKTLAYATGCALLGIETFAAIALQMPTEAISMDVIADAQQGKIYVQRFIQGIAQELEIKAFPSWLNTLPEGTWVTGPGLENYKNKLPKHISHAPPELWLSRPESLLTLGLQRIDRQEKDDPFTLEPIYLRPSSAEEKWQSK